jgi:hypothetical protein
MPFTFKPEISQSPDGQAAPAPSVPSAFGNAQPAMSLSVRTSGEGKSLIEMILFAALGISVVIALGLFGYSYYLSSQVESKKATLQSYESDLGTLPLEDIRKLSNRMKVINQLVKEHPSANVAFKIIEDSIENSITYTKFTLNFNSAGKNYLLSLGGSSPDYKGIAQQIDTLNRKPYANYMQNVKVDQLSPNEKGNVSFSLQSAITVAGLLPEDLNLSDGVAASTAPSASAEGETEQSSAAADAPPATQ